MIDKPPEINETEGTIEGEILPEAENREWLEGMEEYGARLEEEIVQLEDEIGQTESEEERQSIEVLVYDLREQVAGMKEFVEVGRDPDEELYRST